MITFILWCVVTVTVIKTFLWTFEDYEQCFIGPIIEEGYLNHGHQLVEVDLYHYSYFISCIDTCLMPSVIFFSSKISWIKKLNKDWKLGLGQIINKTFRQEKVYDFKKMFVYRVFKQSFMWLDEWWWKVFWPVVIQLLSWIFSFSDNKM